MARDRLSDNDYRRIARKKLESLGASASVGPWAEVKRLADGRAYVEATIEIEPDEARREHDVDAGR